MINNEGDSGMLKLHNTPYLEKTFPLQDICSDSNLPKDPSAGMDVDWSDVNFASISLAVAVAAIQLAATEHQEGADAVKQKIVLPPDDVSQYVSRMNYYSVLGIDMEEQFERRETYDRFVPIAQVPIDQYEADVNGVTSAISDLLAKTMHLSPGAKHKIDYSVGEIVDNIIQHSAAGSPGLVGAQYYPNRKFADICFADCGIGIVASMRENPSYSDTSDGDLILKAFEHGTGQWYGHPQFGTGMVSAGEGLAGLSELVGRLGGHVWVVSHDHSAVVDGDGAHPMTGVTYPGTVIVMRVPDCDVVFPDWDADAEDDPLATGDLW